MALYLIDGDTFSFVTTKDITNEITINTEAYTVTGLQVIENGILAQINVQNIERTSGSGYTPGAGDTLAVGLPIPAAGEAKVLASTLDGRFCFYVTVETKSNYPVKGVAHSGSSGINLRRYPSSDSEVIVTIAEGQAFDILYYYDSVLDTGWTKVKYNGLEGYVMSDFITITERKDIAVAYIGDMSGYTPAAINFLYMIEQN